MRFGAIGQTAANQTLSVDAQRTVNWIPEVVQSGGGKNNLAFQPTPGLNLLSTNGAGPYRGSIGLNIGRAFVISANHLYEIAFAGTATDRGTLTNSTGTCTIDWAGDYLFIVEAPIAGGGSSGKAWSYRLSTNTLTQQTANLITEPLMGFQLDGYFGVTFNNTAEFQISSLRDPTTWNALDFAVTNIISDQTVACKAYNRELYLLGSYESAIYVNNGNADFPFEPAGNGTIQHGCVARDSIAVVNDALMWVGIDRNGRGVVWRMNGYIPQRVSTHPIENLLTVYGLTHPTGSESLAGAFAFSLQVNGHECYVLTYDTSSPSVVYDAATGMWWEWAMGANTSYTAFVGRTHCYAQDRHLIGSRTDGKLYELSNYYTDNAGADVDRMRIGPYIVNENHKLVHSELRVALECQTGRALSMSYTDDGAASYSAAASITVPAAAAFMGGQEARFHRLGYSKSRAYKFVVTDPAGNTKATRLVDAYVEAS